MKWVGFDYGQCIMDSRNRKVEYWMAVVFIDEEKDRPGVIEEKVNLYRELIKKYGDFRRLHEKGRHEVEEKVLEKNQCLIRKYYEVEQKLLKPADGIYEALKHLKSRKYRIDVVSDMAALGTIVNFLNNYNLRNFFTNIYSPEGVLREDGQIDDSFKGTSKEDGSIFEKLKEELESQGISISEAVIVGDHPVKDIEMARKYGFVTVHYAAKEKPSEIADHVITDFRQLLDIL
jgi:FMN phosphatase YigB (HAD superfamily)